MAYRNYSAIGVLILLIHANAAPSDVGKIEEIVEKEKVEPKLDSEPKEIKNDNSTQTQRQKRWYNPFGYGFPTPSPLVYPSYNKRDESVNFGNYGYEDPFIQIHKRIQEIANAVKQPPPPPQPQIPIFYPILFVPTLDCACNENPTTKPPISVDPSTEEAPAVTSRWPEMEDERQNWGFVINETESDDDVDYSRPISFDPIKPNKPTIRPPPPVEHGSVQSGVENNQTLTTTTVKPSQNLAPPTPCDSATLTCCHQQHVDSSCFRIQGCPDFLANGNPCDSKTILRVVETFQRYYSQREG